VSILNKHQQIIDSLLMKDNLHDDNTFYLKSTFHDFRLFDILYAFSLIIELITVQYSY
jgi:hypothetical protein